MKKNPWIAAVLNFFLLGAGYVYTGKRVWFGVLLTVVAIYATWVEQFVIKVQAPDVYNYAFAEFFLLACLMAYDGYQEAKNA